MKTFSIDDFHTLAKIEGRNCLSLYFPTIKRGSEVPQNTIRLKNLCARAQDQLVAMGMEERNIQSFLQPVTALLDEADFWQHQEYGLAVFRHEELAGCLKLPYEVPDICVAANAFHLKPLLPMLTANGQYYLLALSQNQVTLYKGDQTKLTRIEIEELPASMDEALKFDDPEKSLQVHPGKPGSQGQQAGIIHGHGADKDDAKERLWRYFRVVDRGLHTELHDKKTPLLLAAVDYYLPIFKEASRYGHIHPEVLHGNPDERSPQQLGEAAWKLMQPHLNQEQQEAEETIRQGLANGRATSQLEQAVAGAMHGRVDTCFIDLEENIWGVFDDQHAKVNLVDKERPCANDLLDRIAVNTLLHKGRVFPVSGQKAVPGEGPVAALMRY